MSLSYMTVSLALGQMVFPDLRLNTNEAGKPEGLLVGWRKHCREQMIQVAAAANVKVELVKHAFVPETFEFRATKGTGRRAIGFRFAGSAQIDAPYEEPVPELEGPLVVADVGVRFSDSYEAALARWRRFAAWAATLHAEIGAEPTVLLVVSRHVVD